jgi:hypothetical protein
MNPRALFGLSALFSLSSSATFAKLYLWPRLRAMDRERALASLVAPHMFLRFLGLSLLVPGVASPSLPRAFALPTAYGDVVAGLLAIAATIALSKRAPGATPLVWLFSLWGAADLLFANFQGVRVGLDPGALGAAFFIPTALVPPLLVTHFLTFRILLQRAWRATPATPSRPSPAGSTGPHSPATA